MPVVWTDDYGSLWQVLRRFDASEIREWVDDQREWIHEQIEEYWPSKAAEKKNGSEKPNEADAQSDAESEKHR